MSTNVRNKVLELLIERQDQFTSGEEISKLLGVSRAAIWKQIEELRKEGYKIEAKPKQGYQLRFRPDRIAPEEIYPYLHTKWIGRKTKYLETTDSTQIIAHEWAKNGAPDGAFVLAEEQTAGKGRLGRRWHSPSHTGIWMSGIFRPQIPLLYAPQLTLLTSIAVCEVFQATTGTAAGIKWPNDIYVNGKKVCGVLTEVRGDQDQIHYAVIGIGINVNLETVHIPSELREKATSLKIESGASIHRAQLISQIWKRMEELYEQWQEQGFEPIRQLWESHANMLHQEIIATTPQGQKKGIAMGLERNGALLLETNHGMEVIYSAEIESL